MTVHIIDFQKASKKSPLNPLGVRLRRYISEQLDVALSDPAVTSIVLTGGGSSSSANHFSAGADLTEFANPTTSAADTPLNVLVQKIENSTKPIVAAIAGSCLGGGLEVALACHFRIILLNNSSNNNNNKSAAAALPQAKLGLPEVHVGVIPGAGGTQRLPRLIGLQQAAQFILTGRTVSAQQALQLGLVDAIVNVNVNEPQTDETTTTDNTTDANSRVALRETLIKWASWAEVLPIRRVGQLPMKESPAQAHVIMQSIKLSLLPRSGATEGLLAAWEAIDACTRLPLQQGLQVEEEKFFKTLTSESGKAKRHAFFAVRAAQKPLYADARVDNNHALLLSTSSSSSQPNKPCSVAVIGAGTMGSGIAIVLLNAGYHVYLVDVNAQALEKGAALVQSTVEATAQRKKWSPIITKSVLARLQPTSNLEDLSECHLVVEAIVENMKIKQKIFQQLDQLTPKNAILLSNTSTLNIDQMASVFVSAQRRQQFAGWHFFSPAHRMQLVEIVLGQDTSAETVTLMQALTKKIGKIGVVVGNCDGFCGNRLLKPYSAETALLLAEGVADIDAVDRALRDHHGMALGPFQMGDLAGNDVGYFIRKERGWVRENKKNSSAPFPPPQRPHRYTELVDDMITELGRLGQKAGKGWYDYDPNIGKGRKALHSPEMDAFVKKYVTQKRAKKLSDQEIVERTLYPLVNEGFKCLEEGIARSPSDVDVVYLYGYGWPVWKGGPMYWADHIVGLPHLLEKLKEFQNAFPGTEHYVPSSLLVECVKLGLSSEEYYKQGLAEKQGIRSRL